MLNRSHLATSDEEIVEEFGRIVCLMQTVFRKPEFSRRMAEASARGLNWIEAIEHVARTHPGELSRAVS